MNFSLYIGTLLLVIHCVFAIHVYGRILYLFYKKGYISRSEWREHRAIALVLALCVPIFATIVLYLNKNDHFSYYFCFFYPYDSVQYQECDSTYLVDIWTGKNDDFNITEQVKLNWERLKYVNTKDT
mgnify:CR=1 FL=1